MNTASTDTKSEMTWNEAMFYALQVKIMLETLCEPSMVELAGSLRREKSVIDDIKLVCLPLVKLKKKAGELFQKPVNLVTEWIHDPTNTDVLPVKGGDRYQQFLYKGVQINVFMPIKEQYGRILAIRTGPESYSKKMSARWAELGYHGIEGELFDKKTGEHGPLFYTEQAFFDFLGWEYITPEAR